MIKKLIGLELAAKAKAVGLIPEIIKVAQKFDGRKPNKSLDTALKVIDKDLVFKRQYNSFIIEMLISNRSVLSPNRSHCEYTESRTVSIVYSSIATSDQDGICQEGVINGGLLVEKLNKAASDLTSSINFISGQMENIDGILAEHDRIEKERENFKNTTEYMIRNYYKLN